MGVNIHGKAYNVDDLVVEIHKFVEENGGYREGALAAGEFFYEIADDFGVVLDDWFVTVYNEYYEDYNPSHEFNKAVTTYYFPDRREDIQDGELEFYPDGKRFVGGANAGEILETHFEDEFGYEGKFGYE
jgi:hypothetical protein